MIDFRATFTSIAVSPVILYRNWNKLFCEQNYKIELLSVF